MVPKIPSVGSSAVPEPTIEELTNDLKQLKVEIREFIESNRQLPVPIASKDPPKGADGKPLSARKVFEHRLANAPVNELSELVKTKSAWDKLMRDEERQKTDNRLRVLRATAKMGMPLVALGTGLLLTFTGFPWVGFVAIGAGLYSLAPTFLDKITDKLPGGN